MGAVASSIRRPRTSGLRRREIAAGYLFLTPWIIGFFGFVAGPMIASAVLSFTNYDMVNVGKWVGVKNYSFILFKDNLLWPSLLRTFKYAIIIVPPRSLAPCWRRSS